MSSWTLPAAVGFASGILSGLFGIGGGILTTPALRLLLGAPAMVAVGTPLPVIIPSAVTGAIQYVGHRSADLRAGLTIGASGALTAVAGALLAEKVGGTLVLIGTSMLIAYAAVDMFQQVRADGRSPKTAKQGGRAPEQVEPGLAARIGVLAGFYSGFFGLGGGFIIVPMLSRWGRLSMKRAIGTSLIAVTLLAVPGTVAHSVAGNVDWRLAVMLMAGVVPGSLLGVRITMRSHDRALRTGFAVLLVVAAAWLGVSELGSW